MEIFKRVLRSAVSIGIPVAVQYFAASTNPLFLLAAPLLTGIGKWLRDKHQVPYVPV